MGRNRTGRGAVLPPMTTPLSAAHTPLTVEIWSDVVCPWCYIGKRRLESAMSHLEADGTDLSDIEVHWRAFQLDPSAPRPGEHGHGVGIAEHLGQKYGGGIDAGRAMSAQISEVAAGDGLEFHLDDARVGNTVDAHRLLHLAADLGHERDDHRLQDRLKERLLRAYFTQGLDVSDQAVLRDLAVEVGVDESRVDEVLASTAYDSDVQQDQAQAQAYGATGVPFTVIDGRYGISGAQPVEVFVQTLQRALADRAPQLLTMAGAPSDTQTCGPDGCELP